MNTTFDRLAEPPPRVAAATPLVAPRGAVGGQVVLLLLVDVAPGSRLWGYARFVLGSLALRGVPGLRFSRQLGSGYEGGFGVRPSGTRQGLFLAVRRRVGRRRVCPLAARRRLPPACARVLPGQAGAVQRARQLGRGHARAVGAAAPASGAGGGAHAGVDPAAEGRPVLVAGAGRAGAIGVGCRLPAGGGAGRGTPAAPGHLQPVGQRRRR